MAVSVFLNRKSCGSIKHATNKEFTSYTSGKCFYFWRVKYTIEHQSPNPLSQGRIFIFGALAYFKLGPHLKVCNDWCHTNQHYTCSPHSLDKLFQFINILPYSEFPRYQEPEPRQLPSISLTGGPATLSQGTQNSELKPPNKISTPQI